MGCELTNKGQVAKIFYSEPMQTVSVKLRLHRKSPLEYQPLRFDPFNEDIFPKSIGLSKKRRTASRKRILLNSANMMMRSL